VLTVIHFQLLTVTADGGYMTTWLTGHYPDTWKAALAGAAVTDYIESYAFSDVNYAIAMNGQPIYATVPHTTEHRTNPWTAEGREVWMQQSSMSEVSLAWSAQQQRLRQLLSPLLLLPIRSQT
jgi:hypothetical protein